MSKAKYNPTISPAALIASLVAAVLLIGGIVAYFSNHSGSVQMETVKLPPGVHPGMPAGPPANALGAKRNTP